MKLQHTLSPRWAGQRSWAFTLTELMISMTLFTMILGGVIYSHVAGQKLFQWTITKLGASDQSRVAFARLQDDIRSGKTVLVGDVVGTNFTAVADGVAQQGTAIQIHDTTNLNVYVRYYYVPSANEIRRMDTAIGGYRTVAQYLTNNVFFSSEDYQGTVLTASANNRVINVTFKFYQFMYPITQVGSNKLYDYYQLQTKITRRTLE